MRLWFVHSNAVSLQDQMVTQISLGILTGELAPGERLPSVREIARRFSVHANTVSLAYRRLQAEGWVEMRRGSGVYVRMAAALPVKKASAPGEYVNGLIARLLRSSEVLGVARDDLRARFLLALDAAVPPSLLLIEPEVELRRILVAELEQALGRPIPSSGSPEQGGLAGAVALVLPSNADSLRAAMPAGSRIQVLKLRSVPDSLASFLPTPIPKAALVAVLSHWPRFLELARTMLIAAGVDAEALVLLDAGEPGALDRLQVDAVVCDALTARMLPKGVFSIVFRMVSEESLDELQALGLT